MQQRPGQPRRIGFKNPRVTVSLLTLILLLGVLCWPPSPVLPAARQAVIRALPTTLPWPSSQAHADSVPVPPPAQGFKKENLKIVDADLLRVGISDDGMTQLEYPEARLSGTGAFTVTDLSKNVDQPVFKGAAGEQIVIRVDRSGFTLKKADGQVIASQVAGPLQVRPVSPSDPLQVVNITRKGKTPSYHGVLEVTRGYSSPAKLSVVNIVPLQEYLQAVVPNELPSRYGLQAVRAQAIAARNYAIRPREKPWPQFDICDSQYCQVYFGAQTETAETNRAIQDTQGQMALYDGEPILALFSSAHGGYGEAYSNAFSDPKTRQFPAPALPYLTGGPDIGSALDLTTEAGARSFWTNPSTASFDVDSPNYRWEKRWSGAEISATLNRTLAEISKEGVTKDFIAPKFQPGQSIGQLKRLNVLRRGVSGKIMALEVVGTNGTWTLQKEFVIRKALSHGGRMLPSANLVFSHLSGANGQLLTLVANGGGFGHGVGMSQLGASWMDKHGYEYPAIIQHYYKGVSIGSRPVQVGQGGYEQPVQTQFYSTQKEGKLWVEASEPGEPVRVTLNGRELTVDLPLQANDRARGPIVVDDHLQARALNTLVLYPDSRNPQRRVKAWVELYPAKVAAQTARR